MEICSYGCGKEAKFFFKTGKGCCEASPNSCEGKRNRDSEKKKGNFKGTPAWSMPDYIPTEAWNKGLSKSSDERIFDYGRKISKALTGKSGGRGLTPHTEAERKRKISETMKANPKAGGLRSRSGRGKKGWYTGYWCDSSWELAWVVYHLEHGFKFDRNWNGFEYFYKNEKHLYYPDYIIENNYFEIKGRRSYEDLDEKNKEKINQFKGNLSVLYSKEMKLYLDYTISKYGNDFIKLYE